MKGIKFKRKYYKGKIWEYPRYRNGPKIGFLDEKTLQKKKLKKIKYSNGCLI